MNGLENREGFKSVMKVALFLVITWDIYRRCVFVTYDGILALGVIYKNSLRQVFASLRCSILWLILCVCTLHYRQLERGVARQPMRLIYVVSVLQVHKRNTWKQGCQVRKLYPIHIKAGVLGNKPTYCLPVSSCRYTADMFGSVKAPV